MAHGASIEEARFRAFLGQLGEALGHADRLEPLRAYLSGLLLPGDRKSIEPMAARLDPKHVSARHQSMHHFVASASWDHNAVIARALDHALQALERHAPVAAWIVDDTGIPKKGKASVGVGRQYCGILGKQENCQVAVSVSFANETMSIPAAFRLYLPESWARDAVLRQRAGIPPDVQFQTKWEIALEEIARLIGEHRPRAPIVADAGFGDTTAFRDGIRNLGLSYVVAVKEQTTAWPAGRGPLAPKPWSGRGRPPKKLHRDSDHQPLSLLEVARGIAARAWKTVKWREGTRGAMSSRFARVRVRPAHRDQLRSEPRPEEWLLVEWPKGSAEPKRLWLSNFPQDCTLEDLVRIAFLRWRIERDYQELKSEIGLDHYEGRGWRGFHHHGALCIAAYAFLVAERARLSPPQAVAFLKAARVPKGFRPRGAPLAT